MVEPAQIQVKLSHIRTLLAAWYSSLNRFGMVEPHLTHVKHSVLQPKEYVGQFHMNSDWFKVQYNLFCGSVLHVTTSRHWQTISKQVITVLNHAGVCMSCMSTWHYLQRLTDEARYLTDCQAGSLDVGRWQHSYASSSWTPRLVKLYCIKYQFLNFHFLMQTTIPKCWMRCQDLQSAYNTYLTGRWIGFGVVQQYWTCSNYNTT